MLYTYKCQECNEIIELNRRVAEVYDPVECTCGGDARRTILAAPIVSLDPISGDFVGATDKWIKHREQQMRKEKHNMQEHGTYK